MSKVINTIGGGGSGGASAWELVWTNPDVSANFAGQTLPLDLSAYTEIKMEVGWAGDGFTQYVYFGKIGDQMPLTTFAGINTSSGAVTIYRRNCDLRTSNQIIFSDDWSKNLNSTSAGTVANNTNIPYYIYAR